MLTFRQLCRLDSEMPLAHMGVSCIHEGTHAYVSGLGWGGLQVWAFITRFFQLSKTKMRASGYFRIPRLAGGHTWPAGRSAF